MKKEKTLTLIVPFWTVSSHQAAVDICKVMQLRSQDVCDVCVLPGFTNEALISKNGTRS